MLFQSYAILAIVPKTGRKAQCYKGGYAYRGDDREVRLYLHTTSTYSSYGSTFSTFHGITIVRGAVAIVTESVQRVLNCNVILHTVEYLCTCIDAWCVGSGDEGFRNLKKGHLKQHLRKPA